MEVRYYIDPDTEEPHIYNHNVTEEEVEQVLRGWGEDLPGHRGALIRLGQTSHGRYLKVIYVPDEGGRHSLQSPSPASKEKVKMSKCNRFPPGWDEARVKDVLAHYETQTEDEEFAEIEAAADADIVTLIAVPNELVPHVQALLARQKTA